MEKVKVSKEQAEALSALECTLTVAEIVFYYQEKGAFRSNELMSLNEFSLSKLQDALVFGYEIESDRPTPKTPRQMGAQVVPLAPLTQPHTRCQVKPTPEPSTAEALQAELDYELASLSHALSNDDAAEVERSKQRLKEIHEELEGVGC